MYTALIVLDGIASIKKFVAISNKYEFKVNLKNKNCIVDGRSIMGIFSLDLTKPIYRKTTNYGHFGKEDLTWEKIIEL